MSWYWTEELSCNIILALNIKPEKQWIVLDQCMIEMGGSEMLSILSDWTWVIVVEGIVKISVSRCAKK